MIEKVCTAIETFSLTDDAGVLSAADAVMDGQIMLLRVGSVYSFVINPEVEGLADKLNLLKGRQNEQLMSVVCTYEQARRIVDKDRVNEDFFRLTPHFTSRVIVRIPVDTSAGHPFPCNMKTGSAQVLNFEETHPLREAFTKELASRGCEYLAITSGNISRASTLGDLESAKKLAALFNIKAEFFGLRDVRTIVADIPGDDGGHKGSFVILSFCNKDAIEVKRLANKKDREVTESFLKELFETVPTRSPLVYALD